MRHRGDGQPSPRCRPARGSASPRCRASRATRPRPNPALYSPGECPTRRPGSHAATYSPGGCEGAERSRKAARHSRREYWAESVPEKIVQHSPHGWMATYRRGSTLGLRPLTRRTGANSRLALVPRVEGRNESAAIAPEGDCSQRPIVRPSTGYAARSIARCAATRRWLVRLSAMTSQTDTAAGFQPRSAATCAASRRFRSSVPTVSWTSTSSVLSSITRSVRLAACHARMSMTPRSP